MGPPRGWGRLALRDGTTFLSWPSAAVSALTSVTAMFAQACASSKVDDFNKLDLTALIMSQGLTTQAAVMEYVRDHGTEQMQLFVHQRQRYLKDFVAEAMQWGEARQPAAAERQSEWSTLCATADKDCPHGHACSYNQAAAAFFAANSMSLSRAELAVALRNILVTGPAKTTGVPMIVGPTNSGKSTLGPSL